jgi:hypothetical protein
MIIMYWLKMKVVITVIVEEMEWEEESDNWEY